MGPWRSSLIAPATSAPSSVAAELQHVHRSRVAAEHEAEEATTAEDLRKPWRLEVVPELRWASFATVAALDSKRPRAQAAPHAKISPRAPNRIMTHMTSIDDLDEIEKEY